MTTKPQTSSSAGKAMLFMALLTIQFGLQPILTRRFTPKTVCKSTVILVQESVKFVLAMSMLTISGELKKAIEGWSISSWLRVAVVPALLYTVQNTCALTAYQNLDGVTFNVLNQTKTLSAAVCCYLIIGRKQSKLQITALAMLFVSALIVEDLLPLKYLFGDDGDGDGKSQTSERKPQSSSHFSHGVLPVLMASFISGLAGAISQKNLQNGGRNPYLFSSELCIASVLSLSVSLLFSPDGERIKSNGFFDQWTMHTLIPVFTNAIGGIVVGLVTKYAGSVRKGFALIFGMVLTGVAQSINDGLPLSLSQVVGGVLAGLSLWLHATNPYKEAKSQKQD
mmetsp:Transcript_14246/g.21583  ORF Transcript_14246/g.21583 Transcript_14246/m.21583 type:complete len:338 (-) Transcript_14246:655-1668(-)|eukprot:CAMPEP_0203649866 /NCGR_PEP_ID=MMETSP0088-20131115/23041_1 /ASSEMBLY_ACC=CAM_ASM_001087 /TAXON_ID=426623 /ORGANISM="Chaetoceros affinis, Strain CCMP159" /LENGTH=337 /DNA_ID=CAMNT_0050508431 /DNA_START=12 /DNA_END=1025 /DNA_ORIENTATION=+